VGIISLCVHYEHVVDVGFYSAPVDFNKVGQVLVYLSGAFSVWSAVVYFRAFLSMLARRGGGGGVDAQKA
jgi:CDP-diacylglycerol--glycerol-3-phosphate 3-phosphatidyltransferase